jgi:TRAP transporter TAXI family solute receptor
VLARIPAVIFGFIVAVAIALPVFGFDPREFARAHGGVTRVSIATGNAGGVYYPYGGGLARVISRHIPRVQATAEVTAASVDNLKLIQRGKADVAFTLTDTLDDAVRGRGPFARSAVRAQTLAVLYPNYVHIATTTASGIERLADLRGRIVSTGSPGSGTEVSAVRILRAAGIDPDTGIRRQGLSVNASVDALKDGKIDAFFWSGGLPTAAVLDLASSIGVTARLIPHAEVIPALQAHYGPTIYFPLVVPRRTYPDLTSDVAVAGIGNALVVDATMSDDLAFAITKVLFEHRDELAAIHPEAARLRLDTAVTGSPAPFHPGAIRYYRERGVWK